MNSYNNKAHQRNNESVDRNQPKQNRKEAAFKFDDKRPQAVAQRKLQSRADDYVQQQAHPVQKKGTGTGLPDQLKNGIENLSGLSMDDVNVHYNSNQPAQLQAHAYAQGTNIHIAPGQEKHLPHEAWHVVQQKQGRVKPTMQMKGKVNVNDDKGLENEADVMGNKAVRFVQSPSTLPSQLQGKKTDIVQRIAESVMVTGITHLVTAKDGSIYEGEEYGELGHNTAITIDTDQKIRSRRGPNQEFFKEKDKDKEAMYRWFKVLKIGEEAISGEVYIRDDTFTIGNRNALGVRPSLLNSTQRDGRHNILYNPRIEIGKDGRFSLAINQTTKEVLVQVNLALPVGLNFDAEKKMVEGFWGNKFQLLNKITGDSYKVHIVMNIAGKKEEEHYRVLSDSEGNHNVNKSNNSFTHNPSRPDQPNDATNEIQHLVENAIKEGDVQHIKKYFLTKGMRFPIPIDLKLAFSKKQVTAEKAQNFVKKLEPLFESVENVGVSGGKLVEVKGIKEVESTQRAIIHEFGHMIGLGEEYDASTENEQDREPISKVFGEHYAAAAAGGRVNRTTIMGVGEDLMPHHYIGILQAFSQLSHIELVDLDIV